MSELRAQAEYIAIARNHWPITDKTRFVSTSKMRVRIPRTLKLGEKVDVKRIEWKTPGLWGKIIRIAGRLLGKPWGIGAEYYTEDFKSIEIELNPEIGMGYNEEYDILAVHRITQ